MCAFGFWGRVLSITVVSVLFLGEGFGFLFGSLVRFRFLFIDVGMVCFKNSWLFFGCFFLYYLMYLNEVVDL